MEDLGATFRQGVRIDDDPRLVAIIRAAGRRVDSYRSTLTGPTEGELRALSMLGVPAPLADLGVSEELRRASSPSSRGTLAAGSTPRESRPGGQMPTDGSR